MGKKTFVEVKRGRRGYKLFTEDLTDVHTVIRKKRPAVPKYDSPTDDDCLEFGNKNSENLLTL